MTPYHIKLSPRAIKELVALPSKSLKIVIRIMEALSINPRPPGVKKIEGMKDLYSHFINPYRLIYKIEDQEILILMLK